MDKLQQKQSQNTNSLFSEPDLARLACFENKQSGSTPRPECTYFTGEINHLLSEARIEKSWHSHSGLQVLIAIDGIGYYQEKGKPVQMLSAGDVIFILPDILHWHIAADKSDFTDITIPGDSRNELITWLQLSVE